MPELRSNSGESSILVQICDAGQYATHPVFEIELQLRLSHFDGDHEFPMQSKMEGITVYAGALSDLIGFLNDWVDRPLKEQSDFELAGEFNLSVLPGQTLVLRFGKRDDMVSSLNPTVTIEFGAGRYSGEASFITDQSCLREFAISLAKSIAAQAT